MSVAIRALRLLLYSPFVHSYLLKHQFILDIVVLDVVIFCAGLLLIWGGSRLESLLPVERKNIIKELIVERQTMKISELSKEIGVSEMTIHRDIKPLIEEGFIAKTYGGITVAESGTKANFASNQCDYCHREVNERFSYRLILSDNNFVTACCAHCGLLEYRQLGDQVTHAICRDFMMQTTISAQLAWYVMDTSIQVGCCQPQVLTFERKDHADKFVKGFNGEVYSFTAALEVINSKMCGTKHSCDH